MNTETQKTALFTEASRQLFGKKSAPNTGMEVYILTLLEDFHLGEGLTVYEIKMILGKFGLKKSGKKAEIVQRLRLCIGSGQTLKTLHTLWMIVNSSVE
tara:strand:- start:655 stop:951 length:297 start_codon:yes stop_codon:yes gene_type:complete